MVGDVGSFKEVIGSGNFVHRFGWISRVIKLSVLGIEVAVKVVEDWDGEMGLILLLFMKIYGFFRLKLLC